MAQYLPAPGRAPFVINQLHTHLRFRLQHSRNEFCCRDVSLIAHPAHSFCMCALSFALFCERVCGVMHFCQFYILFMVSAIWKSPTPCKHKTFLANKHKISKCSKIYLKKHQLPFPHFSNLVCKLIIPLKTPFMPSDGEISIWNVEILISKRAEPTGDDRVISFGKNSP